MIKLFKNLWKFVKGEKGANYATKEAVLDVNIDAYKAKHRQKIHSRLNSRGKTTLNRYPELEYNHLVFMTVAGFKELDGCGQKTAEHLYGTIQDYLIAFDDDMSYLQAFNDEVSVDKLLEKLNLKGDD